MTIIWRHQAKGPGWTTDSVIKQNIDVSKYKTISGSSYIKLPKELNHPRKCLINVQYIDDNNV